MAIADFQKQVATHPAIGVPGDKASLNPVVYTDRNFIAGDDKVTVGNFAWSDPANSVNGDYHGSGIFKALSGDISGYAPLGIVERNLSYVNYNILDGGTLTVPENAPLQIALKGDYYAVAGNAATKGDKVFANLTDGSIQTAPAGSSIGGHVETSWRVTEGGAAGDIITISSWRA